MPLRSIFDMDSGFFRVLSRVADLMILNIVFIVCCIPIVTIGPALTAMHYVTLKMVDNKEGYIVRGFFKSFRQNLRQAMIIWVILLLLGCLLATDLVILRDSTGMILQVMRVFIFATFVVYFMELIYVFPTLAKFDNSVRATMKNALFMAILDFPRTILMLAIIIAAAFVTLYNGYTFWYGLLVWILLGFSTIAYVNSHFFTKIFKKYISEDEKTDDEEELGELPEPEEEVSDSETEKVETEEKAEEETKEIPELPEDSEK